MISLLDFRESIKKLYIKYETAFKIIAKLIVAFIVFTTIKNELGFEPKLNKNILIILLSVISSITPWAIMVVIAGIISVLNIFYISNILSVLVLLILFILYFLFARYTPKYGYLLLLVPIAFTFNIPYAIPIVLGLYTSPITIIPTSCGIIIYYLIKVIKHAVNIQVNISVEDVLQLYTYVIDNLINNKHLIMTIIIFSIIILVTYYVRRMKFDYSHEISILAGGITCLFGFLISDLTLDVSEQIFGMIIGTIISMAIAFVINYFKLSLDYSGKEVTQFEDETYYYYVKAVPKVIIAAPEKNVTRYMNKDLEEDDDEIKINSIESNIDNIDEDSYL